MLKTKQERMKQKQLKKDEKTNGNNQSLLGIINIKIKFVYSNTICLYLRVFVFVARCSRELGVDFVDALQPVGLVDIAVVVFIGVFCLLSCYYIFNQFDIIMLIVIIMLFVIVIASTTLLSACSVLSYRFLFLCCRRCFICFIT